MLLECDFFTEIWLHYWSAKLFSLCRRIRDFIATEWFSTSNLLSCILSSYYSGTWWTLTIAACTASMHKNLWISPVCTGLLVPHSVFMERHGVLVAHSLSCAENGQVKADIQNQSPASATIHQHKIIAIFQPMEEVCVAPLHPHKLALQFLLRKPKQKQ